MCVTVSVDFFREIQIIYLPKSYLCQADIELYSCMFAFGEAFFVDKLVLHVLTFVVSF